MTDIYFFYLFPRKIFFIIFKHFSLRVKLFRAGDYFRTKTKQKKIQNCFLIPTSAVWLSSCVLISNLALYGRISGVFLLLLQQGKSAILLSKGLEGRRRKKILTTHCELFPRGLAWLVTPQGWLKKLSAKRIELEGIWEQSATCDCCGLVDIEIKHFRTDILQKNVINV